MSFALDSFTGANGTFLHNHVGEVGATWVKKDGHTGAGTDIVINTNRLEKSGSGDARYLASGVNVNDNYTVEMTVRKTNSTINAGAAVAMLARVDANLPSNFYMFSYHIEFKSYMFHKVTDGEFVQFGASVGQEILPGTEARMKLVFDNSQPTNKVIAYVDGVQIYAFDTNQVAVTNRVGIRMAGPESGCAIDNFDAYNHLAPATTGDMSATEAKDVMLFSSGPAGVATISVSDQQDVAAWLAAGGQAAFTRDNFTDINATLLEDHISVENGSTWSRSSLTGQLFINNNKVVKDFTQSISQYQNSAAPPSADYEVEATLHKANADVMEGAAGIAARANVVIGGTLSYNLRYHAGNQGFELWLFCQDVDVQVGGLFLDPLGDGDSRQLRLRTLQEGAFVRVTAYIDDVLRFEVLTDVDTTLLTGRAGLRSYGLGVGMELDSFVARGLGAPAGNLITVESPDVAAASATTYWAAVLAVTEVLDHAIFNAGDVKATIALTEAKDVFVALLVGVAEGDLFNYADIFTLVDIFFGSSLNLSVQMAVTEAKDIFAAEQAQVYSVIMTAFDFSDTAAISVSLGIDVVMNMFEVTEGDIFQAFAFLNIDADMNVIEPQDTAFITNWKPGAGDSIVRLTAYDYSILRVTGFGGGFKP